MPHPQKKKTKIQMPNAVGSTPSDKLNWNGNWNWNWNRNWTNDCDCDLSNVHSLCNYVTIRIDFPPSMFHVPRFSLITLLLPPSFHSLTMHDKVNNCTHKSPEGTWNHKSIVSSVSFLSYTPTTTLDRVFLSNYKSISIKKGNNF